MGKILLKNAGVNGGTAVDLNTTDIQFGWKNNTDAKSQVSTYDIAEPDYTGFENPILTIQGVIDADDNTANVITQALLTDFSLEKDNTTTLGVSLGGNTITTTLNEALDASETGVDVISASGINDGNYIQIDDEVMYVSSQSTNTLTVVRGKANTTAATHANGMNVRIMSVLKGRPTAGYSVGGTMTDTINVSLVDWNFIINTDIIEGQKIGFNLALVEDKP